jgi:hypothetical protein
LHDAFFSILFKAVQPASPKRLPRRFRLPACLAEAAPAPVPPSSLPRRSGSRAVPAAKAGGPTL